MKKRFIALFVIFAMLVPFTPAVVADDNVPRPTVEEILSEYHQKAFEAEAAGETGTASTYSRSGSTGKTLEQETVDTLNAAGYEAYNVTSENYETLEAQLQTDFADMGLAPNGSYIVIISGEDSEASSTAPGVGPRVYVPQEPDTTGDVIPFNYTYNGTTYTMRYVTVTAKDDPNYHLTSNFDLLSNYFDSFLDRLLSSATEIYLDAISKYLHLGTLLSILGVPDYISAYRTSDSVLHYYAATDWTRSYIQVWDSFYEDWHNASCAEYVDMQSKISGYLYNAQTDNTIDVEDKKINKREYSANYSNYEQRKFDAVVGYTLHSVECDAVGSITYRHGNTVVAYHHQNF